MFDYNKTDIKIVEVGARDGLQNEKKPISTKDKVAFIKKLVGSGVQSLELTSFVSPKAIPQLADADDIVKKTKKTVEGLSASVLVPNQKGFERAKKSGVNEIALFTATSETFAQKNINTSIEGSFERFREFSQEALASGMKIRGYISTVFGCPYEGETSLNTLKQIVEELFKIGCYEVSIGDTIGVGTPKQVQDVCKLLSINFDQSKIAMHFHDTRGMALSNILVSLENGIRTFDSSAGGLGGCPYAKGASGNVATEDVLYLCESLGLSTGISLEKMAQASSFILDIINKETPSKFLKTYLDSK